MKSCKKVDGLDRELAGVKSYELQYECDVTVKTQCCWGGSTDMKCHTAERETIDDAVLAPGATAAVSRSCMTGQDEHKPGETFTVKGSMTFVKTENGWTAK